tara:strand:+ start:354 stop:1406 length:1053 start_codon:yes stop_codon:yes gene_type:complete
MLAYLIPYFLLAFFSSLKSKRLDNFLGLFLLILLTLFVGFRFEVGSDWNNYYYHSLIGETSLIKVIQQFLEPAYCFTLWLSSILGWGIVGLNSLNAFVFIFGLIFLCRSLPHPLLGILVSFPYLVIVVGMNYVNQSSAIGVECIALAFYLKKNYKLYYSFLCLAVLFHFSAFYLFVIPIIDSGLNLRKITTFFTFPIIIGGVFIAIDTFFLELFDGNYQYYLLRSYDSKGSLIKILILLSFALIFLLFRKNFIIDNQLERLLITLSINTLIIFIMFFILPSSAVVYRLSLYLFPLQIITSTLIVESKLFGFSVALWKNIFIGLYFAILFVWTNFSYHSIDWFPYRNYLFL